MRSFNLGFVVLALAMCFLVGCKPGKQANLSPDGKTVAVTNDKGLMLHDTTGQRADVHVQLQEASSPVFSPDGKWVAVSAAKKVLLIDTESLKQVDLPSLAGPLAWKPDGLELAGLDGMEVKIVHIPSRSVVRTYKLPRVPDRMVWLSGRDMAFSDARTLYSLRHGQVSSYSTKGEIETLGYDALRDEIIWAEVKEMKPNKSLLGVHACVKEIGPDLKEEATLVPESYYDQLIAPHKGVIGLAAISISPKGDRFVGTLIINESAPGVFEKFVELGGLTQRSPDEALSKRLSALEKQIRIRMVCTEGDIRGPVVGLGSFPAAFDKEPIVTSWSQDGQSVGVVTGDKIKMLHPAR